MKYPNIRTSSEAVERATGKSWDEWVDVIKNSEVATSSHKEIARWLHDAGHIESGWWCQQVTVGYEYAIGRRIVGETKDVGFEIGVNGTVPHTAKNVWKILASQIGVEKWLGKMERFELEPGFVYSTYNGITGEVRRVKEGERMRLTYKPATWNTVSTLQVTLMSKGEKTAIHFHQEKLLDGKQREEMREHWKGVLGEIKDLLEKK